MLQLAEVTREDLRTQPTTKCFDLDVICSPLFCLLFKSQKYEELQLFSPFDSFFPLKQFFCKFRREATSLHEISGWHVVGASRGGYRKPPPDDVIERDPLVNHLTRWSDVTLGPTHAFSTHNVNASGKNDEPGSTCCPTRCHIYSSFHFW